LESVCAGNRTVGSNPTLSASLAEGVCSLRELLAIKPSASSDFSFELRTVNRQSRLILLRIAHFSPELWTLRIRTVLEIPMFQEA